MTNPKIKTKISIVSIQLKEEAPKASTNTPTFKRKEYEAVDFISMEVSDWVFHDLPKDAGMAVRDDLAIIKAIFKDALYNNQPIEPAESKPIYDLVKDYQLSKSFNSPLAESVELVDMVIIPWVERNFRGDLVSNIVPVINKIKSKLDRMNLDGIDK